MTGLLDYCILTLLVFVPFLPALYYFMLVVAESLLSMFSNWSNDRDGH